MSSPRSLTVVGGSFLDEICTAVMNIVPMALSGWILISIPYFPHLTAVFLA